MRVLALDLGEKRTGIAVSDPEFTVAHPLDVLNTHEVLGNTQAFRRILEDYDVERFVVGLPVSLDGVEHAQADRIRKQAEQLSRQYGLPVEFVDERLTSAEAKRILRQMGYNDKEMRGRTDKIAASIILQNWLDTRGSTKKSRDK